MTLKWPNRPCAKVRVDYGGYPQGARRVDSGGYPQGAHARRATDGNRSEELVSRWIARRTLKPRRGQGSALTAGVGIPQCALPRVDWGVTRSARGAVVAKRNAARVAVDVRGLPAVRHACDYGGYPQCA